MAEGGANEADAAEPEASERVRGNKQNGRRGNLNFNFPGLPGLGGLFGGGAGSRGGDIQSFIGSLSSSGISRKSRYKVQVISPTGMGARDMSLRCESISFPGQNIRSVPDSLRFGPEREHAQGMTYGPISATFISDRMQKEKAFFEKWQNNVIDVNTWEPKYYDDYKGGLKIWQLDERNRATYGVELFEVYPKMINAQDVGMTQGNAYQTIIVEFTFHHWFPVATSASAGGTFGGSFLSGINFGFNISHGGLGLNAALNLARGGKPKINTSNTYDRGPDSHRVHPNIYNYIPNREGAQDAGENE